MLKESPQPTKVSQRPLTGTDTVVDACMLTVVTLHQVAQIYQIE